MNQSDWLNWLNSFTQELTRAPGTPLTKAQVIAEVVYEAIDVMRLWSHSQQQQSLDAVQRYLDGYAIDGLSLSCIQPSNEWLRPLLKTICDTAAKELNGNEFLSR